MRVVSLLPAATEIVAALGLVDSLVGISHECDYPAGLELKPRVTHCEIYGQGLSSAVVDRWVNETLVTRGTLYTLDEPLLRELAPEVILTQQLCDVCAVGFGSVAAFAETLPNKPRIVNLEPLSLTDIFCDIQRVAAALKVEARGDALIASLSARVAAVRDRTSQVSQRSRCVHMEWVDPPFCGGHWNPELVEIAGGVDPLGRKGAPSIRVSWEAILEAHPEVLLVACCGYSAAETIRDVELLRNRPGWAELPAVRNGRVFAVNGSAYFSRPGPRVVDSLEILAEILHPDLFAGWFPDRGVARIADVLKEARFAA
jgi:iron complex transport system substrate-binding protein